MVSTPTDLCLFLNKFLKFPPDLPGFILNLARTWQQTKNHLQRKMCECESESEKKKSESLAPDSFPWQEPSNKQKITYREEV